MNLTELPEEAVHSIYSYLDKPSYSSLSKTSKFNKRVGEESGRLFLYPSKSETSFYKGYPLSIYQKDIHVDQFELVNKW